MTDKDPEPSRTLLSAARSLHYLLRHLERVLGTHEKTFIKRRQGHCV
jgi:hypothetical protein